MPEFEVASLSTVDTILWRAFHVSAERHDSSDNNREQKTCTFRIRAFLAPMLIHMSDRHDRSVTALRIRVLNNCLILNP